MEARCYLALSCVSHQNVLQFRRFDFQAVGPGEPAAGAPRRDAALEVLLWTRRNPWLDSDQWWSCCYYDLIEILHCSLRYTRLLQTRMDCYALGRLCKRRVYPARSEALRHDHYDVCCGMVSTGLLIEPRSRDGIHQAADPVATCYAT